MQTYPTCPQYNTLPIPWATHRNKHRGCLVFSLCCIHIRCSTLPITIPTHNELSLALFYFDFFAFFVQHLLATIFTTFLGHLQHSKQHACTNIRRHRSISIVTSFIVIFLSFAFNGWNKTGLSGIHSCTASIGIGRRWNVIGVWTTWTLLPPGNEYYRRHH